MALSASTGGAPTSGRRLRWIILAVVVAMLTVGGTVAYAARSTDRVPTADLFGDATPTPGGSSPAAPSPSVQPGADITGPLNFLIAGIDPRPGQPNWRPNADAVLIMHVPAGMDRAYLFSLPRDLRVDIPAFPKAEFGGARTKLTHAMSYGSKVPGSQRPDRAQGFQLLAQTVSRYTGIKHFDAGAVLNFGGFTELVDSVGGVDMRVDQTVASRHREPDGDHRKPGGDGYIGPQMVYKKGMRHFNGWQALDYGRQRYLTGGDYSRQRHQRQLIKALVGKILSQDMALNPIKLDGVLRALGNSLVFDGRGRDVIDFAYALRRIQASDITLVGLPGEGVGSGGGYLGEQLQQPTGKQFLAALRANRLPSYLASHPALTRPTTAA